MPYDLSSPSVVLTLSDSLQEISGLAMGPTGEWLAAVNDEEGIIFLLSPVTGQILRQIPFADKGDFEGIEITGADAWVVKSSGTLYQVARFLSEDRTVTRYKTGLRKSNDVEGLCFDVDRQGLLLSCKGWGADGPDSLLRKSVFCFDLDVAMLWEEPVLSVVQSDMDRLRGRAEPDFAKAGGPLAPELSEPEPIDFHPSGIAIHPVSGDRYILSSQGKRLVVSDRSGNLLAMVKLDKKILPQPEGICFAADGTLYIASEGKKGNALLCQFDPDRSR
ncbi:MAG: hypothetical protein RLY31_1334 [Bacteroidota bacterium]